MSHNSRADHLISFKRALPAGKRRHPDTRLIPSLIKRIAYLAGTTLKDCETGRVYRQSRHLEVQHAQTVLPEDCKLTERIAEEILQSRSRSSTSGQKGWQSAAEAFLWHAMGWNERHPYAKLGFELTVPLPRDLGDDTNRRLVVELAQYIADKWGVPCFAAVHRGRATGEKGNPHGQIAIGRRALPMDEALHDLPADWEKNWEGFQPMAERLKGVDIRELSHPNGLRQFLVDYKGWWYDRLKNVLKDAGRHLEARLIDSRTNEQLYEADILESPKAPQIHLGQAATQKERRSIPTDRGKFVKDIVDQNRRAAVVSKMVDGRLPALPQLPWGRHFPGDLYLQDFPASAENLRWLDTLDHQSTTRALPRVVFADESGEYAAPTRTKIDLTKLYAFAARSAHTEHQRLLVVPDSRETRLRYYTWLDIACYAETKLREGEQSMAPSRPNMTAVELAKEADKRLSQNLFEHTQIRETDGRKTSGMGAVIDVAWLQCHLARQSPETGRPSAVVKKLEADSVWQIGFPVWPLPASVSADLLSGGPPSQEPQYRLMAPVDSPGEHAFGKGAVVLRQVVPPSLEIGIGSACSSTDGGRFRYQLDRLEFDFRMAAWEVEQNKSIDADQASQRAIWKDLSCWVKVARATGDVMTSSRPLDAETVLSLLDENEQLDWRNPDRMTLPERMLSEPLPGTYNKDTGVSHEVDILWLAGWLHRRRKSIPQTEATVVARNFMHALETTLCSQHSLGTIRVPKRKCTLLEVAQHVGMHLDQDQPSLKSTVSEPKIQPLQTSGDYKDPRRFVTRADVQPEQSTPTNEGTLER